MDRENIPAVQRVGPCFGGTTGRSESLPARHAVAAGYCGIREHSVFALLKRVEDQICRDIFRLRRLIREAESSCVAQEMFRRLIVKREEMLKSVRAELRTG